MCCIIVVAENFSGWKLMTTEQINTVENIKESTITESGNIFSKFSKYRAEILGIALLMITVAHLQPNDMMTSRLHIKYPSQYIINIFNFSGACGIKIFFFLAGFGAYFSLFKNPNELNFYIRRARRMFPYYYPLVFLCIFLYAPNFTIIAGNLSLFGWWLSNWNYDGAGRLSQYFWFHQSIYIIYLMTPFFFRILNNYKKILLNMTLIWLIFIGISLSFPFEIKFLGVQAVPLFVTGMLLGKLNLEGFEIKKWVEPLIYVLGTVSFFLLINFFPTYGGVFYGYKPTTKEQFLIIIFTFMVMLLLLRFFMFIDRGKKLDINFMKISALLGKRSLEIYLIQSFIIFQVFLHNHSENLEKLCNFLHLYNMNNTYLVGILTVSAVVCIFLGIFYGTFMDKIVDNTIDFYKRQKVRLLSIYKTNKSS